MCSTTAAKQLREAVITTSSWYVGFKFKVRLVLLKTHFGFLFSFKQNYYIIVRWVFSFCWWSVLVVPVSAGSLKKSTWTKALGIFAYGNKVIHSAKFEVKSLIKHFLNGFLL